MQNKEDVDINVFVDEYEQLELNKNMYSSVWQLPKWLQDE